MKTKYLFSLFLLSFIFVGCADKLRSQVFVKNKDGNLTAHFNNTIYAKDNQVVNIKMQDASLCGLTESSADKVGSLGNREVLIYADIRKNGIVEPTQIITDMVRDATECKRVTLTSPLFFRKNLNQNDYYEIGIKAYEIDAVGLARAVQATPSGIESIEKMDQSISIDPLLTAIKSILYSVGDLFVSLSGKNIDQWLAHVHATKVMEQYIYVVFDPDFEDNITDTLIIVGNDFVKVVPDQNISAMKNEFNTTMSKLKFDTNLDRQLGSVMTLKVKKQSIQ